jgi:hypothetical protein
MCPSSASPVPGFIWSIGNREAFGRGLTSRPTLPRWAGAFRARPQVRTHDQRETTDLSIVSYFSPERISPQCVFAAGVTGNDSSKRGTSIVPGKKYLTEQAATFLKFAMATTDPEVAAGFLDKAADLRARSEEAPDASPRAPDVEQPES